MQLNHAHYFAAAIAVSLAVTSPTAAAAQTCGGVVPKVIGGEPADVADWPGLAVLRLRDATGAVSIAACGATALSRKWVLTAAHCVTPEFSPDGPYRYTKDWKLKIHDGAGGEIQLRDGLLDVVPADNTFSGSAKGSGLKIVQIIPHENYATTARGLPTRDDIALIELADETPWTGATMPLSADTVADPAVSGTGTILEVAGFGRTKSNPQKLQTTLIESSYFVSFTDRLLAGGVPTLTVEQCRSMNAQNASYIGPNQLCAGTLGIDSCSGDSGGPLSMCSSDNRRYQVGIVSWGSNYCGADGNYAGVYTRVSAYQDWIIGRTGPLGGEAGTEPATTARSVAEVESLLEEMKLLFVEDPRVGQMPLTAMRNDTTRIEGGKEPRLVIGDKFAFRVTPPADGKLLLVEINPDLEVTQLFPNRYWREGDEIVKGGQEISIPVAQLHGFSAFQVHAPAGPHRVLALLLPPNFDLAKINRPHMGLRQENRNAFAATDASVTYLATLLTEVANYLRTYNSAADRNFVAVPNLTMFADLEVFDVK